MDAIVLNLIMIAIFLGVAFPVHEFAHAFAAYVRGDATAKQFGRLTLNPVVHFDPVGGVMTIVSVFLGGLLIGWAKPTPVNTINLRDRRNDEVLVALAGPASNLVMAILGGIVFRLAGMELPTSGLLEAAVWLFVVFNVTLAIFNLIPIPPLDGSTLLFRVLPAKTAWEVRPFLNQYGIFVLLAFVILGGQVIAPFVSNVSRILVGG